MKTNKIQDGRTFTNIQVYANILEFLTKKSEAGEQVEEPAAEEPSVEAETPGEEISEDSQ